MSSSNLQEIAAGVASTASKEWHSFIDPFLSIGDRFALKLSDPQDQQLRHELYRAVFGHMASGFFSLLYADPQHPDFWPLWNTAFSHMGPCPDFVTYITPLDDNGVYKIFGYRNTVKNVDFQFGTGNFMPRGDNDQLNTGNSLANLDIDSLTIGKDGAFEVLVSPTRPEGYAGDWWQLHPKTTYLMVRQKSHDWLNELDARLGIERLDRAVVKPRPSTAELARNMKQMARWVEGNLTVAVGLMQLYRKKGWINKVDYLDLTNCSGIITQKYAYGVFVLEPDEAMILEGEVPQQSQYWSVHLTDDLFITLDYMNRQTSLNNHTTRVDKDGRFRIVISAQDPGVPNWLDTAGYRAGAIQGRWDGCSSWPEHVSSKVKLAEVRKHLPDDTPVVTSAEREASIRLRRRAAKLRKRW